MRNNSVCGIGLQEAGSARRANLDGVFVAEEAFCNFVIRMKIGEVLGDELSVV